jgi:hypothetical protein
MLLVGTEDGHRSSQPIQPKKRTFIPEPHTYRKRMRGPIKDLVLVEASQSGKSIANTFVVRQGRHGRLLLKFTNASWLDLLTSLFLVSAPRDSLLLGRFSGRTSIKRFAYSKKSSTQPAEFDPQFLPLYMTQLRSFSLTDTADAFRQGASWYRNGRDWAKEQRDDAIRHINEQATRDPIEVTAVNASFSTVCQTSSDESFESFTQQSHL